MRKLLLLFVCVCASISAWALMPPGQPELFGSCGSEQVLKIDVNEAGQLSAALASAKLQGLDFQYLHIKTGPQEVTLNDDDIAALNALNITTIDMQTANFADFTLDNSKASYILLPFGWTKEQVKAVGETHKNYANFKACLSTSDTKNNGDATLIAYLGQSNTMADAISHTYFTKKDGNVEDTKTLGGGYGDCSRLKYLTVMGNICARDISSEGAYDENGHYITNGVPDENTTTYNKNTAGQNYYAGGNTPGALHANTRDLYALDLRDAYVPDEYAADIVFPYSNMGGTNLKEIWMPEDPRLKTVPADYLNINSKYIHQICIPGNIEYIKTRAFAGSGTAIDYVWTTGPAGNTKYDNGAYFVTSGSDEPVLKYKDNPDSSDPANLDWEDGDDNNFTYGTITLPPNLRLIERHAFSSSSHVRDVYVLNETAPECHVDAFSSVMYHANNTLVASSIKEVEGVKIITRDAYTLSGYQMMTMLHYPRTTATPQTQRYTDPSREYNISTGERDGNGNMLYFPTHTEFATAHDQGTFGYLWNGWNIERTWYNNEIMLNGTQTYYGSLSGSSGHDSSNGQQSANNFYDINNNTEVDKTVGSFYDVTMSDSNQPGGYTKPDGLKDYWTLTRGGNQLYPQAVSTTSNYVYVRDDNGDYVKEVTGNQTTGNTLSFRDYNGSADDGLERYSRKQVVVTDGQGNPEFESCTDGNYVEDYEWVEYENGDFIHDIEVDENTEGAYVKDYTFTEDNENGKYYHPLVATAAPADIWNTSSYSPSDYFWGAATYTQDDNGEWVKFWGETYRTAENVQAHELNDFNAAAADPANHYSKKVTGYTRCTSPDDINNHQADLYKVGENYVLYEEGAADYIANVNGTKYTKSYSNTYRAYNMSTDAGEQRYDVVDNGYREYDASTDEGKQRYDKNYLGTYHLATAADAGEDTYCMKTVDYVSDTPITYSVQNDYRGWHQFVLAATAHNSKIPFEPLRSFISDNDWWTICEPYDLRYSDLVMFFGTDRQGFEKKIPYLSKLMYVVRDVKNEKITLTFSKNLMEYKEVINGNHVHGTIDDNMKWTPEELAEDPIILHKGVPYLIKPNMTLVEGKYVRQFDIFKETKSDLYERLHESQSQTGKEQFDMIYAGEYTVPAFVVGYDADGALSENTQDSKTIENKDGSSFTYESGTIKYKGKNVSYKISSDFSYTFVGTLYKSAMPQYCYFLGWDSNNNCAAFWYSRVLDMDGWNWNNETGIICPNFDTSLEIHQATGFNDPARWIFNPNNKTDKVEVYVKCDDFPGGSTGSAKSYSMEFGAVNDAVTTGIRELNTLPETNSKELHIYTTDGIYMGSSANNLPKGVYIVNGKKYVVK